jgi:hypothetical protein
VAPQAEPRGIYGPRGLRPVLLVALCVIQAGVFGSLIAALATFLPGIGASLAVGAALLRGTTLLSLQDDVGDAMTRNSPPR